MPLYPLGETGVFPIRTLVVPDLPLRRQLLETIEPDVIGMNRLMGTYERA